MTRNDGVKRSYYYLTPLIILLIPFGAWLNFNFNILLLQFLVVTIYFFTRNVNDYRSSRVVLRILFSIIATILIIPFLLFIGIFAMIPMILVNPELWMGKAFLAPYFLILSFLMIYSVMTIFEHQSNRVALLFYSSLRKWFLFKAPIYVLCGVFLSYIPMFVSDHSDVWYKLYQYLILIILFAFSILGYSNKNFRNKKYCSLFYKYISLTAIPVAVGLLVDLLTLRNGYSDYNGSDNYDFQIGTICIIIVLMIALTIKFKRKIAAIFTIIVSVLLINSLINDSNDSRRESVYILRNYIFNENFSKIELNEIYCEFNRKNVRIKADDKLILEITQDELFRRLFDSYGTANFIDNLKRMEQDSTSIILTQNDTLIPISQLSIEIIGKDIKLNQIAIRDLYFRKKDGRIE